MAKKKYRVYKKGGMIKRADGGLLNYQEGGFTPHIMINPQTGEEFFAETNADHLRYSDMGYVHEDEMRMGGYIDQYKSGGYVADNFKPPELKTLPEDYLFSPIQGLDFNFKNKTDDKKGSIEDLEFKHGGYSMGNYAPDRSNSNLNKTLDALEEGKELICSHKWDDFDKLDEQTAELVKKQVEHQAKNIADICKSQGFNLPSELKNWLDDLFKVNPPTLNWKKALSRFVHGSIETFRKRTKKKRNKRYPDAKGSKTKFKPRGIVYLDGSGSVHKSEYEMFYSELQYLKDVINFDIAHFDYHVATPYKYKGENKLPKSGGGTSFKAVSEHFNKNSKDYSFGIILTDGEAEDPGRFMKPMLWLVTTEHGMSCIENYHGIKIKMKKN